MATKIQLLLVKLAPSLAAQIMFVFVSCMIATNRQMEQVPFGVEPNEHGTWYYGRDGWCDGQVCFNISLAVLLLRLSDEFVIAGCAPMGRQCN